MERKLIDAKPLMENGWHLVRTGKSNEHLASLSLADVPTVDAVEVEHGYWEVVEPKKFPNETARIRCSSCKKEPKKHTHHDQGHGYSFDVDSWDATDYCPNCGAKMDGERKDNVPSST